MDQPIQITFRDIPHSEAVELHIREEVEKLNQYFDHIVSCQVVVEFDSKNQNKGNLHNVHIRVSVPGKILAVHNHPQENLYISIRDAFDSVTRQIKDYAQRLHGDIKTHSELTHGEIVRLFENFGFIRTHGDDTEFYFNSTNTVSPRFEHLKVGMEVQFIEALGDDGPQAHRVSVHKRQQKQAEK